MSIDIACLRGGLIALVAAGCAASGADQAAAPAPRAPAVAVAAALPADPGPRTPLAACSSIAAKPPEISRAPLDLAVPPLVDRDGAMAPLYERLARLIRGRARDHVRIAVYGDSNLTMDWITGRMRRVLQARYGDAGHGFVALGRPWSHYKHMDVEQFVSKALTSYAVSTKPIPDGGYGFSGIAAEGASGALARVSTAGGDAPVGKRVGRFDVYFLRGPRLGRFDVKIDGAKVSAVETAAERMTAGFHRVPVTDGPHRMEVVAASPRRVRLLGAVLERETPGIVVDSLGVGAMNTRCITREAPEVNVPMLRHRRYDLVVVMTGTNDVFELDKQRQYVGQVVAMHREALPGVPILLVSPPDRGKFKSFELTVAVGLQRREIAAELGTAFWDLWGAMGGRSSMARFAALGLAQPDFIHFSLQGGAWVGDRLVHAMLRDFEAWLAAHPEAGCHGEDATDDAPRAFASTP